MKNKIEFISDYLITPTSSIEGFALVKHFGFERVNVNITFDENEADLLNYLKAMNSLNVISSTFGESSDEFQMFAADLGVNPKEIENITLDPKFLKTLDKLHEKASAIKEQLTHIKEASYSCADFFASLQGINTSENERMLIGGLLGEQGAILSLSDECSDPECGLAVTEEGERVVMQFPFRSGASGFLHEWAHALEFSLEKGDAIDIKDEDTLKRIASIREDIAAARRGVLQNDSQWILENIPKISNKRILNNDKAIDLFWESLSISEKECLAKRFPAIGDLEAADRILNLMQMSNLPSGLITALNSINDEQLNEVVNIAAFVSEPKDPNKLSDDTKSELLSLAVKQKKALMEQVKAHVEEVLLDAGASSVSLSSMTGAKIISTMASILFDEATKNGSRRKSHEMAITQGILKMIAGAKNEIPLIQEGLESSLKVALDNLDSSKMIKNALRAKTTTGEKNFTLFRLGKCKSSDNTSLFRLGDCFWAITRVERNQVALLKSGKKEGYHPLAGSLSRRMEGASVIANHMLWGEGNVGKVSKHTAMITPFEIGVAKRSQRTCDLSSGLREFGIDIQTASKIIEKTRQVLSNTDGYLSLAKKGMDPLDPVLWRTKKIDNPSTSPGNKRREFAKNVMSTICDTYGLFLTQEKLDKVLLTLDRGPSRGYANGIYGVIQRASSLIADSRASRESWAYGLESVARTCAGNNSKAFKLLRDNIVDALPETGMEWTAFHPDPQDADLMVVAFKNLLSWASCRREATKKPSMRAFPSIDLPTFGQSCELLDATPKYSF